MAERVAKSRKGPRKHQRLNSDRLNKSMPGLYPDGDGLYLRVSPAKSKSWVFRFMLDGKPNAMGLGSYPEVSLIRARELAREARERRALGIDPIKERDRLQAEKRAAEARAKTFKECAEGYIAAHKAGWKNAKHAAQWEATLATYAYPVFGDSPVSAVTGDHVLEALKPIWTKKTETAKRVRGRIELVLDWAKAKRYRDGDNPARWRGGLQAFLPSLAKVRTVRHHPALPYAELSAFMGEVQDQEGLAALALQLTILTAARTSEVLLAQWPEFDLGKAVWTVPGERMKAGREHRVPLSKPALALLKARHEATGGKGFVFPGERPRKPLSNMAMLMLLERMGRDDLTVHGFRSTFRDWVEEETSFAGSVAEAALAHVVGDKVEKAYRRGDLFEKRRELMAAWASYCLPSEAGNVVPMKRQAEGGA